MLLCSIPVAYATEPVLCPDDVCEETLVACETCGKDAVFCITCERCYDCNPMVVEDTPDMVDYTKETAVTAVGPYQEAYYTVSVPAVLNPGETRQVHVEGYWMSNQVLKVTVDKELILRKGEKTLSLQVFFEDIIQRGSETESFDIYRDISVETIEVLFGTWSGSICYDVEFVTE